MPWTQQYLEIVRLLDLNMADDARATILIDRMVEKRNISTLRRIIQGKNVIVYGCGPSLEDDVYKIHEAGLHSKLVNVAVDGSVKALLGYNIVPQINVTDLDGDIKSILKANHYGCVTIIHAHGDNINALIKYVPLFKGVVYATTQSDPTGRVHNFGGFTDGDRAVHIADHFNPRIIALAGMDFGNVVGVYSGIYNKIRKPWKLRIGRELIERLAKSSKTPMFNITSGGEYIKGVDKITVHKLGQIV
jgi:uncharacterized Rossmann fold enzyme